MVRQIVTCTPNTRVLPFASDNPRYPARYSVNVGVQTIFISCEAFGAVVTVYVHTMGWSGRKTVLHALNACNPSCRASSNATLLFDSRLLMLPPAGA